MADVILNVTVPEAHIAETFDAFNTIIDSYLVIKCTGSQNMPDGSDFHGEWDRTRIAPQQPGETTKQFGQRVLRELGMAILHMVSKAKDEIRYKTEVSAVVPPASDVPDDVLT